MNAKLTEMPLTTEARVLYTIYCIIVYQLWGGNVYDSSIGVRSQRT